MKQSIVIVCCVFLLAPVLLLAAKKNENTRRDGRTQLCCAAELAGDTPTSVAFQGIRLTFKTKYNILGNSALDTCKPCHTADAGPFPPPGLNPYGFSLKAALPSIPDVALALASIEALDSDGDICTNLEEINAGFFPGDPTSGPPPCFVPVRGATWGMIKALYDEAR